MAHVVGPGFLDSPSNPKLSGGLVGNEGILPLCNRAGGNFAEPVWEWNMQVATDLLDMARFVQNRPPSLRFLSTYAQEVNVEKARLKLCCSDLVVLHEQFFSFCGPFCCSCLPYSSLPTFLF